MNPFFHFVVLSRAGDMTAQGAFAPALLQGRTNAKTNETGRSRYFYTITGPAANLNTGANGFFAADADFPLVTFEENQLILAEAALRLSENPKFIAVLNALNEVRSYHDANAYKAFGTATYKSYEQADFDAGGLLNPNGLKPEEALLKEILTEKYLSLMGQIETFNDIRRARTLSGTRNVIGIPTKNPGVPTIPQRLLIPQSEINTNQSVNQSALPGLFEPTPVNQ